MHYFELMGYRDLIEIEQGSTDSDTDLRLADSSRQDFSSDFDFVLSSVRSNRLFFCPKQFSR